MEDREIIDRDIAIIGRMTFKTGPLSPVFGPGDFERNDYHSNRDLLKLYGDDSELDLEQLARRCGADLHVLRVADLIVWGCAKGILDRVGLDRWRLLDPIMQWELVGGDGFSLRTRGLSGEHARTAAKLMKRELGRQRRARDRAIGR